MKFKDLSNMLLEYLTDEQRSRYVETAGSDIAKKNRKYTLTNTLQKIKKLRYCLIWEKV